MKRLLFSAAAATSLTLGGCATNPAYDREFAGAATGAVIGAGAGAARAPSFPASALVRVRLWAACSAASLAV